MARSADLLPGGGSSVYNMHSLSAGRRADARAPPPRLQDRRRSLSCSLTRARRRAHSVRHVDAGITRPRRRGGARAHQRPELRPRRPRDHPLGEPGRERGSSGTCGASCSRRSSRRRRSAARRTSSPRRSPETATTTDAEVVSVDDRGNRLLVEVNSVRLIRGDRGGRRLRPARGRAGQRAALRHIHALTPRQTEVLRLLEHGRSTDQIAAGAAPEPRDRPQPHPAHPPGARCALPARGGRGRAPGAPCRGAGPSSRPRRALAGRSFCRFVLIARRRWLSRAHAQGSTSL